MNHSELQRSTALPNAIPQTSTRLEFRYRYLLLLAPFAAVLWFSIWQPIQVLPRISLAPGFRFVDQDGNQLTSDDMRGQFTFYTFTYTRCSAECPQTVPGLQVIESAVSSLDTDGIPVSYVTISIDPAYDTPAQLRAYARQYVTQSSAWHFVSGEPDHLKQVIGNGFNTYYAPQSPGAFTIDPVYVLVDGWGIIRATYRTRDPDAARIQSDVSLLVKEVQNQSGAARYAYEAAHLFLCYPRT